MYENIFEKLNNSNSGITMNFYEKDGYQILALTGSLDTYNSNIFTDTLAAIIDSTTSKQIILDLGKITYVSSTGIGSFLNILKQCAAKSVDMYLLTVQQKVVEVFQLLGFTSFINFISALSEIKTNKQTNFPVVVQCPHCNIKLRAVKSGRFKCASCKNIISITEAGKTE